MHLERLVLSLSAHTAPQQLPLAAPAASHTYPPHTHTQLARTSSMWSAATSRMIPGGMLVKADTVLSTTRCT